ncbi:hypothetical protein CR513_35640, partial [Mucuna pruriens]
MNGMLVGWIFNIIDPSLRYKCQRSLEQSEGMIFRYSVSNDVRIYQLNTNIANCKQSRQNLVAYYGNLKTTWEALANYTKNPTCNCVGCQCGGTQDWHKSGRRRKSINF